MIILYSQAHFGGFGMANGNVIEKKCVKKDKVNMKCYYFQKFGTK